MADNIFVSPEDAAQLAASLPSAPPEQKERILDTLTAFKEQELGRMQEREFTLRKSFTAPNFGLDESNFQALDSTLSKSTDPEAAKYRLFNEQFLASRFNRPTEAASRNYSAWRDVYAKDKFGMPKADDKTFFERVSADFKLDDALSKAAMERAMKDDPLLAAWAEAGAELQNDPAWPKIGSDEKMKGFMRAYQETASTLRPYRDLIKNAVDSMNRLMDGKAQEGDEAVQEQTVNALAEMPVAKARLVMAAMRQAVDAKGGENAKEKGGAFNGKFWQQVGESAFRMGKGMSANTMMVEDALSSVPTSGKVLSPVGEIKTLEDAQRFVRAKTIEDISQRSAASASGGTAGMGFQPPGGEEIQITPEASRLIQQVISREEKKIRLGREWAALEQGIDPVVSTTANLFGSSGAALAVTALTRGASIPMMAQGYTNLRYDELRLQYPQMKPGDARMIAGASGIAEAALDKVGVSAFYKLPGLKSLLQKGISKVLVPRVISRAALVNTAEAGIEAAQDYSAPLIQTVLSEVKKDVPGYDWNREAGFFSKYAEHWVTMIPLTLVFGGAASLREYNGTKDLMSFNDELGALGVVETDRIAVTEALQAGDTAKADALMADANARRDPAVAEMFQEKIGVEMKQQAEAIQQQMQDAEVSIEKVADGWRVTSPDGSATFPDHDTAFLTVLDRMEQQELSRDDNTLRVFEEFSRDAKEGESFTVSDKALTLADAEADATARGDQNTVDAVWKRLEVERQKLGRDDLGLSDFRILGQSVTQFKEGVATYANRIYDGGRAVDLVEEKAESDAKRFIAQGRTSLEALRAAILQVQEATGDTYLNGDTDTAVYEAYSDLARLYATGTRRGNATAGAVRKQEASIIRDQRNKLRKAEKDGIATGLMQKMQETLEFFRQVLKQAARLMKAKREGKLGDIEQFLNESLGLSEQAAHVDAVQNEVAEMAGTTAPTFSLSSSRATPADASKVTVLPDGAQLVGPTSFSIRAYHGTPHKVDKFSLDKIGTGEGAQAFGWGLYFAENRRIAEWYRQKLAGTSTQWTDEELDRLEADLETATAEHYVSKEFDIDTWRIKAAGGHILGHGKDADAAWEDARKPLKGPGNLYTIELLPDPDDFIDWDKREQSPKVKEALLKKYGAEYIDLLEGFPGSEIYFDLMRDEFDGSEPATSAALAAFGIPGIKYLDGTSRADGEGTYNYVIFDESLVKTLEENGKPVAEMAGPTFSIRMASKPEAAQNNSASPGGLTVEEVERIEWLNADDLIPRNEVEKPEQVDELRSLFSNGWVGRPLLGVRLPDGKIQLLTGSHRFAAAQEVDIAIPVVVIDVSALEEGLQSAEDEGRAIWSIGSDGFLTQREEEQIHDLKAAGFKFESALLKEEEEYYWGEEKGKLSTRFDIPAAANESSRTDSPSASFSIALSERLDAVAAALGERGKGKPQERVAILQRAQERLSGARAVWERIDRSAKGLDRAASETPDRYGEELAQLRADFDAEMAEIRSERETEIGGAKADKAGKETVNRIRAEFNAALAKRRTEYERDRRALEDKQSAEESAQAKEQGRVSKSEMTAAMRALDAVVSVLPPELRGRVGGFIKLAELTTTAQRVDEIERRFVKVQELLEKHFQGELIEQIEKILEKSEQGKNARGVKQGRLTPETQRYFDDVRQVWEMTPKELEKHISSIEAALDSTESPPTFEEQQRLTDQWDVAMRFGALSDKDAAALSSALDRLQQEYKGARNLRKAHEDARKNQVESLIKAGLSDIGAPRGVTPADLNRRAMKDDTDLIEAMQGVKGFVSENLLSVRHQLTRVFGEDSAVTQHFDDKLRQAHNKEYDIMTALEKEWQAKIAELTGAKPGTAKGTRKAARFMRDLFTIQEKPGILVNLSQKTVEKEVVRDMAEKIAADPDYARSLGYTPKEADTLRDLLADPANDRKRKFTLKETTDVGAVQEFPMSQAQAVQFLLTWRQDAGRQQMERDGWTEENAAQLAAFIQPATMRLAEWMAGKYQTDGWEMGNPVYERMFFMSMPRSRNYAPLRRSTGGKDEGLSIEEMGMMQGSSTPGMMIGRVVSNAPIRTENGVTVFWQHWGALARWVSHAEIIRDMQAVLRNKELRDAIIAKHGKEKYQGLSERIEETRTGGGGAAYSLAFIDRIVRNITKARVFSALAYNIGTTMKQTPALLNHFLSTDLPTTAILKGWGKLITGQINADKLWEVPGIKQRLNTRFSPEGRAAMSSRGMTPGIIMRSLEKGMVQHRYADVAWNIAGAAISYDHHLNEALKAGASQIEAELAAIEKTDQMLYETAQPDAAGARGMLSNKKNSLLSFVWLFQTDPMQKGAIELMAAKKFLQGVRGGKFEGVAARQIVTAHILQPLLLWASSGVVRFLIAGDDAEDAWDIDDLLAAIYLGPFSGIMFFGDSLSSLVRRLTGTRQWASSSNPMVASFAKGNIWEAAFEGVKEVGKALVPALSAYDVGERIINQGVGLIENASE